MNVRWAALPCLMVAIFLPSSDGAAQPAEKPQRVGIMVNGGVRAFIDRFRRDFEKLGFVDGKTVTFEGKFAEGKLDRLPALAGELVQAEVDVILALGGPAARAAKNATTKIPVVFAIVTDPVALGLVASLDKPGGNVTGVTNLDREQAPQQLALLKEALPALKRVAILSDDTIPGADARGLAPIDQANENAARALGLQPFVIKLKGGPAPDIEAAFAAMAKEGAEAVLVLETPVPFTHRARIAEVAAANKIPAMFPGGFADAGGLITYGTSVLDAWPMMSGQAVRILKGAKPADMPVEFVTRRELIFNLKSARQLGITIAPELLKRADRLIE